MNYLYIYHPRFLVKVLQKLEIVVKVYFSNLEDLYKKDQKRIEDEIWSLVNVRDSIVVDFGIGRSTEKLVSLGARVVAVDNDLRKNTEVL